MYLFFMTWFKPTERVASKEFLIALSKIVVKEVSGLNVSQVYIEKQLKEYVKQTVLKKEKEI